MRAKMVTIKAHKGALCRECDDKIIKKGERALQISGRSAKGFFKSFYCIPHARYIIKMFAELTV